MNRSGHTILPILFAVLSVMIIAFIFSNSLKNGEESNAISKPIVEAVEAIFDPNDTIPTKTFNYIVRKTAHFIEFAVLGAVLGGLMRVLQMSGRKSASKRTENRKPFGSPLVKVLLIGFTVAAVDETIQIFTGRTNSILDVLIDTLGVLAGIGSVHLLHRHSRKQTQQNE